MASSGFGKFDFLQLFGAGSRDACLFDGGNSRVDLSAFCHDVRGMDLAQGEQFFVSLLLLQDGRRRSDSPEQRSALGKACHVRSCELDSTLLLKVWACRDADATCDTFDVDSGPLKSSGRKERLCAELRIPLQRSVLGESQGLLYQSWVSLDRPGMAWDPDASAMAMAHGDESRTFDQRFVEGPRQMAQPRACLTICRTADLSASGKLSLTFEAPAETRESQWPGLLRSQSQHYSMSKALHLQILQLQAGGGMTSDPAGERDVESFEIQAIKGRLKECTNSIHEVYRQINEMEARINESERKLNEAPSCGLEEDVSPRRARVEEVFAEADRLQQAAARMSAGGTSAVSEPGFGDAAMRSQEAELEAQHLKAENEEKQERIESIHADFAKIKEEANRKIDAANERIRLLRGERDHHRETADRLHLEAQRLDAQNRELCNESSQLAEQRQALLRIVEDLHETCSVHAGGLDVSQARQSVDSIKASIKASFAFC